MQKMEKKIWNTKKIKTMQNARDILGLFLDVLSVSGIIMPKQD